MLRFSTCTIHFAPMIHLIQLHHKFEQTIRKRHLNTSITFCFELCFLAYTFTRLIRAVRAWELVVQSLLLGYSLNSTGLRNSMNYPPGQNGFHVRISKEDKFIEKSNKWMDMDEKEVLFLRNKIQKALVSSRILTNTYVCALA
ncbi:hypothetical protein CDAR_246511 [Caerostris darwini]|uniref:Uncharacterized protein n=1 Tax=Caerostris darwini TaxID=1538125 RepID=A0AAV4TC64_9ARAC|nr:hypothetical protein CDAR_246511 [Caerostris darwini]